MLVGSEVRRVAIVGGARIPFARAHGPYANLTNQDMLTAAFKAVVDKFALKGERLGDAGAGAVIKHSRDWDLVRECVMASGLAFETPGFDLQRACGTSLETAIIIGSKIALGQIDCGLAGGVDGVERSAGCVLARVPAAAVAQRPRAYVLGKDSPVLRSAPASLQAGAARRSGATHRPQHGTELRTHGEAVADHARRAGPARSGKP